MSKQPKYSKMEEKAIEIFNAPFETLTICQKSIVRNGVWKDEKERQDKNII